MKKLLILLVSLCVSLATMAQSRTQITDGVFIAQYGSVYVIENDNAQQTVRIKVTKEKSAYDIFCNDTLYKTVAKAGLKAAIEGAIIAASGGTSGGWVSSAVASDASNRIYNWVCAKLK